MKIIEKNSGKTIAVIDEERIRILDAVNYELIEDEGGENGN